MPPPPSRVARAARCMDRAVRVGHSVRCFRAGDALPPGAQASLRGRAGCSHHRRLHGRRRTALLGRQRVQLHVPRPVLEPATGGTTHRAGAHPTRIQGPSQRLPRARVHRGSNPLGRRIPRRRTNRRLSRHHRLQPRFSSTVRRLHSRTEPACEAIWRRLPGHGRAGTTR